MSEDGFTFLTKVVGPLVVDGLKMFREWRAKNLSDTAEKAKVLLQTNGSDPEKVKAPPSVVYQIAEAASIVDDDNVQAMWAGLLASSCSSDGRDESNKVFVHVVRQLTASQVRFLNHICQVSKKTKGGVGLIFPATELKLTVAEARDISGIEDIHQLDIELDHLRHLQLLFEGGGLQLDSEEIECTPTPLALNLYVRAQGTRKPATEFYALTDGPPLNTQIRVGSVVMNREAKKRLDEKKAGSHD